MLIMPAIDIMGGACVRLRQGRFDEVSIYSDPVEQAAEFGKAGAEWMHIVDLDGARECRPMQHAMFRSLARATNVKIQCGGGVRERSHAEALLDAGIARVVVGSAAVRQPEEVRGWIGFFGADRVCCAFDVRPADGRFDVMADGWTVGSGRSLFEVLELYPPGTLKHALVTDVTRDGALGGPNAELIALLAHTRPDLAVQASGGVASLADLAALRKAGAAAAIVGRALYERRFTLEAALAG